MVKKFKQEQYEKEEEIRIAAAKDFPWKFKPKRNGTITCHISLDSWTDHVTNVYNSQNDNQFPEKLKDHDYSLSLPEGGYESEWLENTEDTENLNRQISENEAWNILAS